MGTTLAPTNIDHHRTFGLDPSIGFEALRAEQPTASADFTLDPTPVLRRALPGFDPLARYREAMTSSVSRPGTLVDVFA